MSMKQQTAIPKAVRIKVLERDSVDDAPCCIFCGNPRNLQIAHYVSRARGGKGVEQNLVTLCFWCHQAADNGFGERSEEIRNYMETYLKEHYPGWNKEDLITNGKSI